MRLQHLLKAGKVLYFNDSMYDNKSSFLQRFSLTQPLTISKTRKPPFPLVNDVTANAFCNDEENWLSRFFAMEGNIRVTKMNEKKTISCVVEILNKAAQVMETDFVH